MNGRFDSNSALCQLHFHSCNEILCYQRSLHKQGPHDLQHKPEKEVTTSAPTHVSKMASPPHTAALPTCALVKPRVPSLGYAA